MALFKTNFEVILAGEQEIDIYYEKAAQQINLLLEKYDIRDINNQLEKVDATWLKALLSIDGFFQATPLKSIFYDRKQQYVPDEIVTAFRNIISDAPLNIKAVFFDTFLTLLVQKGWSGSLDE